NRQLLADRATAAGLEGLDAVVRQTGMFSLLPLDRAQVIRMREAHGVYLTPSGRINLCGVNSGNVDPLVGALSDVMR
ncbi:MAG: aminotransferase class I/II-fold pyridoxal phosphate-dependent enzyme, partial [Pseudomonadota bacterium]